MLTQRAKIHNRFDFEIYDVETGETTKAKAENIVLNSLYGQLIPGTGYFVNIEVGTGTGILAATRTSLFSPLAYKVVADVEKVYDTDLSCHWTRKAVFSDIEAIGLWSEVGITYSVYNIITHALITDAEGNPITINKTNTKIITVYATIYYELLEPSPGSNYLHYGSNNTILAFFLGNSSISFSFMPSSLKRIDGKLSLLGCYATLAGTKNNDIPNKRVYSSLLKVGIAQANGQIRGFLVGASYSTAFGASSLPLTGLFEKYDFTGVAVGTGDGVNKQFDLPLAYPMQESEKIYVAGVLKTRGIDYIIHYGMKSTDTMLLDLPTGTEMRYPTKSLIFEETIELPNPKGSYFSDGASIVTSISFKNGANQQFVSYKIELSLDDVTYITAGESALTANQVVTLNTFAAAKYKYMRIRFVSGYSGGFGTLFYFKIYATPPAKKHIEFVSAPAASAAITSDFAVDYIPKSTNFTLDLQAEVLFGEGI